MNMHDAPAMLCTACGGSAVLDDKVRSAFWHDDRLVVVEGIPALVCKRCGERFYDDRAAIDLDRMMGNGFPPELAQRVMQVPVFDYADVVACTAPP
jgi:YgiT-type zinc finger domain-containing protein